MMEGRFSEYVDSGAERSQSSDMGDGDLGLVTGVLSGEGRFCLSDSGDPLTALMSSLFLDLGVLSPGLVSSSGVTLMVTDVPTLSEISR